MDITNNYLAVLNAILIVDMIGIYLSNIDFIKSKNLKLWYYKYKLSAVIADVLIIFIGIVFTNYFYYKFFNKFSLIKFIILILIFQIIHDISFYFFIKNYKKNENEMIDTFKDYANEVSYFAIIGDSTMIIASCLIAYYLIKFTNNSNIIILVVLLYILQYLIYNKNKFVLK